MQKRFLYLLILMFMLPTSVAATASVLPSTAGQTNLAAGRPVIFSPKPNAGDAHTLTDGKLVKNPGEIWGKGGWVGPRSVRWYYRGKVNFAVDLGRVSHINEVAIRFAGGSHFVRGSLWPNLDFPGLVEIFVSNDGKHYRKAAQYSRFKKGAFDALNLPLKPGKTWGYTLRLKLTDVTARYVGVQVYGGAYTFADEMWVFGKKAKGLGTGNEGRAERKTIASGFTVARPQPYFYKPYLVVATNVALPQPLGLIMPSRKIQKPLALTITLPKGVQLTGGWLRGKKVQDLSKLASQSLADGRTRYHLTLSPDLLNGWHSKAKPVGELFIQATGWKDGQTGQLTYSFQNASWSSGAIHMALHAVKMKPAVQLKHVMVSMGWYMAWMSSYWPHVFDAWDMIGLNTFPIFGWYRMKPSTLTKNFSTRKDRQAWHMLKEARQRGFDILNIDVTYKRMEKRHHNDPAIFCQFEGGSVGKDICPSYRGKWYQQEINRFAAMTALVKPDYSASDIEIWNVNGPDSKRCTRCQADFKASGLSSWKAWRHAKATQIWRDFVSAARKAVRKAGGNPKFDIGIYNLRSIAPYQKMWYFSQLYPKWATYSAPSEYSMLYPQDIVIVGNEVRKERKRMTGNDIMPWLTPGGAGPVPGWAMKAVWLETLTNGGRGILFWLGDTLDGEQLVAINRVVRAIAPVENVIIKGRPVGDKMIKVSGPGRVSGIMLGGEIVVLVADYFHKTGDQVKLKMNLPSGCMVSDLLRGNKQIMRLPSGEQTFTVDLHGRRVGLFLFKANGQS